MNIIFSKSKENEDKGQDGYYFYSASGGPASLKRKNQVENRHK